MGSSSGYGSQSTVRLDNTNANANGGGAVGVATHAGGMPQTPGGSNDQHQQSHNATLTEGRLKIYSQIFEKLDKWSKIKERDNPFLAKVNLFEYSPQSF